MSFADVSSTAMATPVSSAAAEASPRSEIQKILLHHGVAEVRDGVIQFKSPSQSAFDLAGMVQELLIISEPQSNPHPSTHLPLQPPPPTSPDSTDTFHSTPITVAHSNLQADANTSKGAPAAEKLLAENKIHVTMDHLNDASKSDVVAASPPNRAPSASSADNHQRDAGCSTLSNSPPKLLFQYRNLAGALYSVPITIPCPTPSGETPTSFYADADTLAAYCDEKDKAEKLGKLNKSAMNKNVTTRKIDASRPIRTVHQLTGQSKSNVAKQYGIPFEEVGEWGLEMMADGAYRLRSIRGNCNNPLTNISDSKETSASSTRALDSDIDGTEAGSSRSERAGETTSGQNADDLNGNGGSATSEMSEIVSSTDDDSLVLPPGIELPAFPEIGNGGLLEGDPNGTDSDGDWGGDAGTNSSESTTRKVRKAVSPNQQDISAAPINVVPGWAKSRTLNSESSNGSKNVSGDEKTRNNTNVSTNPSVYFVKLGHLQSLIAKQLHVELLHVEFPELIGVVIESESSEPLCLTEQPVLDVHDIGRGNSRAEERWVPFYVAHTNSQGSITSRSPLEDTRGPVASIEFRVAVMNFKWAKSTPRYPLPPHVHALLYHHPKENFRRYCYCRGYLECVCYQEVLSKGHGSAYDEYLLALLFMIDMDSWRHDPEALHSEPRVTKEHRRMFGASLNRDEVLRILGLADAEPDLCFRDGLISDFEESLDPAMRDDPEVKSAIMKWRRQYEIGVEKNWCQIRWCNQAYLNRKKK